MHNQPMEISSAPPSYKSTRPAHSRYRIAAEYADYFPAVDFPDYGAFLAVLGSAVKRERRTLVTIVQRSREGFPVDEVSSFVLKVYKYPVLPRLRTALQISKAEREFNGLRYLNEIGIGAAQAVGYGVQRDAFGFVRSCFVITRFIDDSINLAKWYTEVNDQDELDGKRVDAVFTELGRILRRLHRAHFFLFTAKSKNILISKHHAPDQLFLIDLPYARTLPWRIFARWAQARDIGVLLGNVATSLSERAIELFYRSYLPDPLGYSAKAVRRYALRQMRAKQNRTAISRWVHNMKRRLAGKPPLAGFLFLSAVMYG
jgi:tRNA A-37 threonylcarbamoyl transferase component Bud32